MPTVKPDVFSKTLAPHLQHCRLSVIAEFFASQLLEGQLMQLSRGAPPTVVPANRAGLTSCTEQSWWSSLFTLETQVESGKSSFVTQVTYRKTETL